MGVLVVGFLVGLVSMALANWIGGPPFVAWSIGFATAVIWREALDAVKAIP